MFRNFCLEENSHIESDEDYGNIGYWLFKYTDYFDFENNLWGKQHYIIWILISVTLWAVQTWVVLFTYRTITDDIGGVLEITL